jgi:hypothetical protein
LPLFLLLALLLLLRWIWLCVVACPALVASCPLIMALRMHHFLCFLDFLVLLVRMALMELDLDASKFMPCLLSFPLSRTVSFLVASCIALGLEDGI